MRTSWRSSDNRKVVVAIFVATHLARSLDYQPKPSLYIDRIVSGKLGWRQPQALKQIGLASRCLLRGPLSPTEEVPSRLLTRFAIAEDDALHLVVLLEEPDHALQKRM